MAKELNQLKKKIVKGIYEPIHSRYSQDLSNVINLCL